MGKKLSQASVKITKNHHHHHDHNNKKNLNTMIKVLRPKVYITDSSTFKTLVQQLTGIGETTVTTNPTPVQSTIAQKPVTDVGIMNFREGVELLPIIEILEDDDQAYHETSQEFSYDSSDLSLPSMSISSFTTLDQYSPDQLRMKTTVTAPLESSSGVDELMDFNSQYGDIESWLLDMDPFVYNYDGYVPMIQREVGVYDYDLTRLI